MAGIPENNQYTDNSNVSSSGIFGSNFQNFLKNIPSNVPKSTQNPSVFIPEYNTYNSTPSISETYKNLVPVKANSPLGTRADTPREPILADYRTKLLPGQKDANGKDMWVTPSDQTYTRNWPESLGGGQYAIDPTQPGAIVKSNRGSGDTVYDSKETALLRGGSSKYDVQIDHIIPLWLGGEDTLANKEALSTTQHNQKTKAQAVVLTLLNQGKIDNNQARLMAFDWKNLDTSKVPYPGDTGMIDPKKADQINKDWDWDKAHIPGTFGHSLGDSIKAVWKGIPDALNTFIPVPDKNEHPIEYSLLKPVSEFSKGLVEGATGGVVSASPEQDTGGFFGKFERIIGNTIGTIVSMKAFGAVLSKAGSITDSVLSKIPGLNKVYGVPKAKLVQAGNWVSEGIGNKTATFIDKNLIQKFPKISGVVSGLASKAKGLVGKKVVDLTEEELVSKAKSMGVQDIPVLLDKKALAGLKYGDTVKQAMFFGSYGVATKLARDGLTQQDEGNLYDYTKEFLTNATTGAIFSTSGQNWRGYTKLASATMILGTINRDSFEDNLANKAMMVGLHATGSDKAQRMGLTEGAAEGIKRPQVNQLEMLSNEVDKTATKMAIQKIDQWTPVKVGDYTKFPNVQKVTNTEAPKYTTPQLEKIKESGLKSIEDTLTETARKEGTDEHTLQEKISDEQLRFLAAIRQLDKGGLRVIERTNADVADVKSVAQKLANSNTTKGADGSPVPNIIRDTHFSDGNARMQFTPNINALPVIDVNGNYKYTDVSGEFSINSGTEPNSPIFPVSGTGSSIDGGKAQFDTFKEDVNKGRSTGKIYFTNESPNYLKALLNENAKYKPGEIKPTGKPHVPHSAKEMENTITAYRDIKNEDGTWDILKVGYVARENKIADMNKNVELYPARNGSPSLLKYPTRNNNVTMGEFMKSHNIDVLTGQVLSLQTDPGPVGTRTAVKSSGKRENHLRVFLPDTYIKDSIEASKENTQRQTTPTPSDTTVPPTTPAMTPEVSPLATKISEVAKTQPAPGLTEQDKIDLAKAGYNEEQMARMKPKTKIETYTPPPKEVVTEPAQETPQEKEKLPDPGQFIQTRRGSEGVNELAASEIKDIKKQKDFTRAKLTELAKSVSGEGKTRQGVIDGWPKFLDSFIEKVKIASGNTSFDIPENKDLNKLKKLYTTLAKAGSRPEVVLNKEGASFKEGGVQNVGKIDLLTKEFNQREGFPEDSMKVVHVSEDSTYEGVKNGIQSSNKFDALKDKMSNINGEKYLPVGISAKGIENTVFIKFEPKMVERFDSNPEKYLNEGEEITTPEDKFMRTYIVDVLGMPKNIADADFVKRANLIYHRYDQYHGPEKTINLKILKANKIGDEPAFNIDTKKFENPDSPEAKSAVKSLHDSKRVDGQIYMGEKVFDEYIKGLGYDPNQHVGSIKALIDTTVDGKKVYHKGQFTKVDDAIRIQYKDEYGIDIGPDDVISFDSNAKIGPKTGEFTIPLSDIYAKNRSTTDSISKDSPSHERKFLSTDPGVKADTLKETEKNVKDLQDFNNEIAKTQNKQELEIVLDKYAERFNLDKNVLFQGAKGKAFDLGAAKNNLAVEISQYLKNKMLDAVVTPKYKNSTMVTINAPLKADYDGNGKLRYPNDNEIVLGKEQLKALKIKEGDSVVVHRDPSYDINNVLVLKAVDGTKLGHTSLAKENGEISPFNERIILQGDQDADTMHVTKIGEGGIPQSQVDAIKKRGSLATPFTEVNPSEQNFTTAKTIQDKIKDQLAGDDQTSWISTQARIMDEVTDNKITIKINKVEKGEKQSKAEIYSNGKKVGEKLVSKSPIEFTAAPKWGERERQLISQAQRAAVDSKKSKDIFNMTEQNNPVWAVKQLWSTGDANTMADWQARSVKEALSTIQKPYSVKKLFEESKTINDVLEGKIIDKKTNQRDRDSGLAPVIDYYNNLKKTGTELTPQQEKILTYSKLVPFSSSEGTTVASHKIGVDAVKKDFEKKYNSKNPKLAEIKVIAALAKKENLKKGVSKREKKIAQSKVEDFFLNNLEEGKYTQNDLDNIAYWAVTDKAANISQYEHFDNPKYIFLYKELINASPKVAKSYYEGFESYQEPKNDGQGGPGPKKFNNLIKNMKNDKIGQIVAVARHGSTDSNGEKVFRGWKESKRNQLSIKGKGDAIKLGQSVKKLVGNNPKDYIIVYSDLNRAHDTAETVSRISGVPCGKAYKDLRSQDTGDFSGKKEDEVKDEIEEYTFEYPDKSLPGATESHTQFIKRIKNVFNQIPKDYPNKKIIVITHHQVEVLQANNFNKATQAMFDKGIEPGGLRTI